MAEEKTPAQIGSDNANKMKVNNLVQRAEDIANTTHIPDYSYESFRIGCEVAGIAAGFCFLVVKYHKEIMEAMHTVLTVK